jgi:hypothetical protein
MTEYIQTKYNLNEAYQKIFGEKLGDYTIARIDYFKNIPYGKAKLLATSLFKNDSQYIIEEEETEDYWIFLGMSMLTNKKINPLQYTDYGDFIIFWY